MCDKILACLDGILGLWDFAFCVGEIKSCKILARLDGILGLWDFFYPDFENLYKPNGAEYAAISGGAL
jgi:hypothetical protein